MFLRTRMILYCEHAHVCMFIQCAVFPSSCDVSAGLRTRASLIRAGHANFDMYMFTHYWAHKS